MAKSSLSPVTAYAQDVIDGRIVACRWVRLACERHLRDLPEGAKSSMGRGIYFDDEAAQLAIDFFPAFLCFYEGDFDGRPFILEPWQQFIIGSIFGWKGRDGFRRFRTAYVETAKGSGKSPLAAGIGLYGLVADGEPGAEIYAAATTREQAGILFRDAKAFAEGSPSLKKRLQIDKANIAYAKANSFFRPVSSEHRGLDGKRPSICLIDEIHEHPNAMVVDKMRAGTKGRRQALLFEITNAGYDRNSVCFHHHEYSEKILEGVLENDSWFTYMTGLDVCDACRAAGKTTPTDGCPDCDDWRDERTWLKANPNIGVSIPAKYLREQVAEAVEMPSKENIVKRLNFCIWTESETKWIGMDAWAACSAPVSEPSLAGRPAFGGLDLSSTTDLSALVWAVPDDDGESYDILARFWIPADNIERRVRRDRVPYDQWVRQGYITATPGNIVDYSFILDAIRRDSEALDIRELAFDRWGSQKIVADLVDIGFTVDPERRDRVLVQMGQGFASMSGPSKEIEKLVLARRIRHGGNPVLSWNVANAVIRMDPAGNYKPDKEKSTERIDGLVALIMAISRATARGIQRSVYEERGIVTL